MPNPNTISYSELIDRRYISAFKWPNPNSSSGSWNAIITGYANKGRGEVLFGKLEVKIARSLSTIAVESDVYICLALEALFCSGLSTFSLFHLIKQTTTNYHIPHYVLWSFMFMFGMNVKLA